MKAFIRIWRGHFLLAEFGLSVVLLFTFIVWMEKCGGSVTVDAVLKGNRSAVYGALTSVFGSLLGFVITAVSIVLGFSSSDHLAVVRQSRHYTTLWKVFVAGIRALSFATIASFVGLLIDRDEATNHIVLYFATFGTVLAIFRVSRCIWILEMIIHIVTQPQKSASGR